MTYLYMLTFLLIVYIILNKILAGYIDYVDFYENCQNLVFLLHVFKQISKLFEYTLQTNSLTKVVINLSKSLNRDTTQREFHYIILKRIW